MALVPFASLEVVIEQAMDGEARNYATNLEWISSYV